MAFRFDHEQMLFDAAGQGLSQSALARKAKVSQTGAWRFLTGQAQTPGMAKKLATALGFEVSRYLIRKRQRVAVGQ